MDPRCRRSPVIEIDRQRRRARRNHQGIRRRTDPPLDRLRRFRRRRPHLSHHPHPALHRLSHALVRLLAPILSFTMEEIWPHVGETGSVHTSVFPDGAQLAEGIHTEQRERVTVWTKLIALREPVLKSLEAARQEKV